MASIQKRGDSYRIVVSMGYDIKVKELRELQAMVEEATAQIEAIKDSIKMKMVD